MAKIATAWVGIVIVILFLMGLTAHFQIERHHEKKLRVFDLAKEYRVTLRATNAQFSDRWNEYLNDSVDPYNGGNIDEQAYNDLVNRFLNTDTNRDNYEALAGFYESVGECVKERLCDFWFARRTFGNDIVTFYHNMYPALDAENQQGHSDDGIVDFYNRMKSADKGEIRPGWDETIDSWAY